MQQRPRHRKAFTAFAIEAEPRLRRALIGAVGHDRVADAVAEALAYAWEHWDAVAVMANPVGYLYRVGQTRVRARKRPPVFAVEPAHIPEIEPELTNVLMRLPERQRASVWLIHGCQWTRREVAEALGISPSTVGNHIDRAMQTLRAELGASNARP